MKKRVEGLLISLIIISLLTLVIAAENDTNADTNDDVSENLEGFEKAYSCLKNQLGDDCAASSNTEQTAFSLLAIAYDSSLQSDCKSSLMNLKKDNCWPASSGGTCDLKSTSQAILALNHINKNVDDYVDWLEDKKILATNLNWFLEIDANEAASCTIKVNGANEQTFTINENKKISGTSSCLTPAENNYYLKISDSCLSSNFTISCDKDFVTTLLYKIGSTYYISSLTHSAPASGTTEEKVNSYCFGFNDCSYEGSLWAVLALAKTGKDITSYLPYLNSMYEESENTKYFPSAFLYMLTNEDDYQADITGKQQQGKFWDESGNRYYDSAVALLALQDILIEEVSNSKTWLLSIQDLSGCWHSNNIRDTAFILYAAWPKNPAISEENGRAYCNQFNFYCTAAEECPADEILENYYCPGLSDVCCQTEPAELSCTDKGGIECGEGYECTSTPVFASDTFYCCLDSCIEVSATTECEEYNYNCRISCLDNEEEKLGYSCNSGDKCCGEKPKKKGNWTLVILLIILIILVILAIIFRNQLKVWWFRFKSKLKFGKPPGPPSGRPSMQPPTTPMLMRPRQIIPRGHVPVRRPPARMPVRTKKPEKDTVFEETMKKLRDMAK